VDSFTDTISLAVVDIAQWATFDEKHTLMVDALSDKLDQSPSVFSAISDARNAALEMMPGTSDRTAGIDYGTLLRGFLQSVDDAAVTSKVQDALTAYEPLVAYFVKDSVMDDATGLSIYWPSPSFLYHPYVPMAGLAFAPRLLRMFASDGLGPPGALCMEETDTASYCWV
jgi:hypothetical protein